MEREFLPCVLVLAPCAEVQEIFISYPTKQCKELSIKFPPGVSAAQRAGHSQEGAEEEGAGSEERYRETEHDAVDAQTAGESEHPRRGQPYHGIAHEGYPQHRHHMRGAAQSVGEDHLSGVAELIED